jgi:Tol biopolymer transport system component
LFGTLTIAPDGTRVAVVETDQRNGNADIWIVDVASGRRTRLTVNPASEGAPIWSPDGRQILFRSNRGGRWGHYRKAVDGSGTEELLEELSFMPNETHWSPDGRFVISFSARSSSDARNDLWALPMTGAGKRASVPFVRTPADETAGRFSPDSKWVAYLSDESGVVDLYVSRLTVGSETSNADAPGKWVVSTNGSLGAARWRKDGRELVYLAPDGGMMATQITPGATFQSSPPRLLFRLPLTLLRTTLAPGARIDATSDNERFLVAMPTAQAALQELTVVLNWPALLRSRQ